MKKFLLSVVAVGYSMMMQAAGFSISSNEKIEFAPGNLQYQASTNTWRFAEHQWDFVGNAEKGNVYVGETKCDNANIAADYSGWIDLYGFGTGDNPTNTSAVNTDYVFADWGKNIISNDAANTWRTLTHDEWQFIFSGRANANKLRGKATVNEVPGFVFLPDGAEVPAGLSFSHNLEAKCSANTYDASQWTQMEAIGAVFLPAAYFRYVTTVMANQDPQGHYWSSNTHDQNENFAWCFEFYNNDVATVHYMGRAYAMSVRLVKPAMPESISNTSVTPKAVKSIVNGQVFILRGEKTYTVTGQEVK